MVVPDFTIFTLVSCSRDRLMILATLQWFLPWAAQGVWALKKLCNNQSKLTKFMIKSRLSEKLQFTFFFFPVHYSSINHSGQSRVRRKIYLPYCKSIRILFVNTWFFHWLKEINHVGIFRLDVLTNNSSVDVPWFLYAQMIWRIIQAFVSYIFTSFLPLNNLTRFFVVLLQKA